MHRSISKRPHCGKSISKQTHDANQLRALFQTCVWPSNRRRRTCPSARAANRKQQVSTSLERFEPSSIPAWFQAVPPGSGSVRNQLTFQPPHRSAARVLCVQPPNRHSQGVDTEAFMPGIEWGANLDTVHMWLGVNGAGPNRHPSSRARGPGSN